jgi:hypothetical protein
MTTPCTHHGLIEIVEPLVAYAKALHDTHGCRVGPPYPTPIAWAEDWLRAARQRMLAAEAAKEDTA